MYFLCSIVWGESTMNYGEILHLVSGFWSYILYPLPWAYNNTTYIVIMKDLYMLWLISGLGWFKLDLGQIVFILYFMPGKKKMFHSLYSYKEDYARNKIKNM